MSRKRCFIMVACEYRSHCKHSHVESKDYFQPRHTGEHCDHYEPLDVEYDLHERIAQMMGAHS